MSTTVKYIHSGTVPMNASEMTKRGKINKNFWYLYGNATRGVDKRAEVTPLSWFSPAALQNFWNDNVGPMSLKHQGSSHVGQIQEEIADCQGGKQERPQDSFILRSCHICQS